MKVIDPGHIYELNWLDVERGFEAEDFDGPGCRDLRFVKREGEKYPGNVGHYAGTTMQEVLRAIIDRLKYVHAQKPDPLNNFAMNNLRSAFYNLELRAALRHGRTLNFSLAEIDCIETLPTCAKCGHIGCRGECRA